MGTKQAKLVMGRIIASLREEMLMSRYALAKSAGVDCSWLRRFEQGKSGVRVETLIALAQGLQMPASRIMAMIELALEEAGPKLEEGPTGPGRKEEEKGGGHAP